MRTLLVKNALKVNSEEGDGCQDGTPLVVFAERELPQELQDKVNEENIQFPGEKLYFMIEKESDLPLPIAVGSNKVLITSDEVVEYKLNHESTEAYLELVEERFIKPMGFIYYS